MALALGWAGVEFLGVLLQRIPAEPGELLLLAWLRLSVENPLRTAVAIALVLPLRPGGTRGGHPGPAAGQGKDAETISELGGWR